MWWLLFILAVFGGIWLFYTRRRFRYSQMVEGWAQKPVFITGCDSGFGRQLALELDSKGVPVFAGCLNKNGIEGLIKEASEKLKACLLDVKCTESITEACQFVQDNLPSGTELWGVVNNAGILKSSGPLEFMSRPRFEEVFQVNVFGMAEVCRIFLPLLRKSRGRIVNVTSVNGLVPAPCLIPYSASKFAAESLSGSLRAELSLYGVSVHVIEPSGYKTNIMSQCAEDIANNWQQLPPHIKDLYGLKYVEQVKAALGSGLNKRMATDFSPIIAAEMHALFAKDPRTHYQVGRGAKIIFLLCYFLPPFITDPLMRRVVKGFVPRYLAVKKK